MNNEHTPTLPPSAVVGTACVIALALLVGPGTAYIGTNFSAATAAESAKQSTQLADMTADLDRATGRKAPVVSSGIGKRDARLDDVAARHRTIRDHERAHKNKLREIEALRIVAKNSQKIAAPKLMGGTDAAHPKIVVVDKGRATLHPGARVFQLTELGTPFAGALKGADHVTLLLHTKGFETFSKVERAVRKSLPDAAIGFLPIKSGWSFQFPANSKDENHVK